MEQQEKARNETELNKKTKLWGWIVTLVFAGIPYLILVVCIEIAKTQFSDISWRSVYGITGLILATIIAGILFAKGKQFCFKKVRSILEKRKKK